MLTILALMAGAGFEFSGKAALRPEQFTLAGDAGMGAARWSAKAPSKAPADIEPAAQRQCGRDEHNCAPPYRAFLPAQRSYGELCLLERCRHRLFGPPCSTKGIVKKAAGTVKNTDRAGVLPC
jgi:hypothetical protein